MTPQTHNELTILLYAQVAKMKLDADIEDLNKLIEKNLKPYKAKHQSYCKSLKTKS